MLTNFVLDKNKIYQIFCQITPIVISNGQKYASHYTLSTACIGGEFVGGKDGFKINNVSSDSLIDEYIEEFCINVSLRDEKFEILIDSTLECNLCAFATIKITEF